MNLKKIFIKDACPTKVGGQAVLDGIMMKGEDRTAVVVRLPGNRMHIKTTKLAPAKKAAKIPVVRGVYIFVSTLMIGMKTLMYSAEIAEKYFEEEDEPTEKAGKTATGTAGGIDENDRLREDEAAEMPYDAIQGGADENPELTESHASEAVGEGSEGMAADDGSAKTEPDGGDSAKKPHPEVPTAAKATPGKSTGGIPFSTMIVASVALAILFVVGFFIILPTLAINFLDGYVHNSIVMNLIEGVLRIVMFVLYILIVSKMEDIRTVFRYHGAEHKTIHCFENGLELTPENAEKFETLHPRCGTSFLMFVMVISLLLFSLLGWPNLLIRIASRIILIPLIAGLSYELLKAAGQGTSTIVKILSVPGLLLQYLTTKEPTRDQLEVAIAALKAVLVPRDTPLIEGFCDENGEELPVEGIS
ncbi:MAG: DUF1385 domain-containing protein [Clostridiales Family XIII bacterium]|jgi:uncharacterized protein YqhQ|nr:DUF1385 domain-containing protein [Clostridiales Family XIII bacterium]